MQREQHQHEHDDPWQINQGDRATAGEEPVNRIKITRKLQSVTVIAAGAQWPGDGGVMRRLEQIVMDAVGHFQHRFAADAVEHSLKRVDQHQHDKQADQGRHTAARQHRVIDQHHVGRSREHEEIEQRARAHDEHQIAPVAAQEEAQELTVHYGCIPSIGSVTWQLPAGRHLYSLHCGKVI